MYKNGTGGKEGRRELFEIARRTLQFMVKRSRDEEYFVEQMHLEHDKAQRYFRHLILDLKTQLLKDISVHSKIWIFTAGNTA